MPDPPPFINYADPNVTPSASLRPSSRPARYQRNTHRQRPLMPPPPAPEDEQNLGPGAAGVGAGGPGLSRAVSQRATARSTLMQDQQHAREQASAQAQGPTNDQSQTNGHGSYTNGHSPVPTASPPGSAQPSDPAANRGSWRASMISTRDADPDAEPIDGRHQTALKVGERAYPVDLQRDPQAHSNSGTDPSGGVVNASNIGTDEDPIRLAMMKLQNAGSVHRQSGQLTPSATSPVSATSRPGGQFPTQTQDNARRSMSPTKPRTQSNDLSPPLSSPRPGPTNASQIDYRRSAEFVVGPPPTASRPVSPNPNPNSNPVVNPPTANFMRPPSQGAMTGPSSNLPINAVLDRYHQSLPGERKSMSSRPSSRAESATRPLSANLEGHAGIGARGRSTSPQPFLPVSRSTSPNTNVSPVTNGQVSKRSSYNNRVPPPSVGPNGQVGAVRHGSTSSISVPSLTQRPTSAGGNSVGIALDPSGRVAQDDMAAAYRDQQQQQQQQQPQPTSQQYFPQQPQTSPQQPAVPQSQLQHHSSYGSGRNVAALPPAQQPPPPPQQVMTPISQTGMYPQAVSAYQQQQQLPPMHPYAAGQQVQQQQPMYDRNMYGAQQPYAQPAVEYSGGLVQRGPSMRGYYSQGQQGLIQQPQQQQASYRAPSPRAPSPQPQYQNQPPPTGQYTDDGRGVLFYGKPTLLTISRFAY